MQRRRNMMQTRQDSEVRPSVSEKSRIGPESPSNTDHEDAKAAPVPEAAEARCAGDTDSDSSSAPVNELSTLFSWQSGLQNRFRK